MRRFGAAVAWEDERTIAVDPAPYAPTGCFSVEADWSAASYWFEMAALTPDADACLLLKGLQQDSLQGDSRVKDLFEPLGVRAEWQADGLLLQKTATPGNAPTIYEADLATCPDLAQTVCVACAMLRRPFRLTGLSTLRIKETDRLAALQTELRKLGRSIEIDGDDTLAYDGNAVPVSPENIIIETYADEPTGNLDFETSKRIVSILQTIRQKGTAVVMITHNLNLLQLFPGIVYNCEGGKLEEVNNEYNAPIELEEENKNKPKE